MKFTLSQPAFAALAEHACPIVNGRVIPILGCALVETSSEGVRLTATDMDMMVSASAGAENCKPGAVCVDAQRLRDFVSGCHSGSQIEGELTGEKFVLRSGRARANFNVLPADEFPRFDLAGKLTHRFEMPGKELARLLGETIWAASTEETRYYLRGVFLEFGERLYAVATDGHVLAMRSMALPNDTDGAPNVIIPPAAAKAIASIATHAESVRVSLGEEMICVEAGDFTVASKLVNGTYPDWRRVVPSFSAKPAVLEREALLRAVKLVSRSADAVKKTRALKLEFGEGLALSGAGDAAEFNDEIDISYRGKPLAIGFNGAYLAQALESFSGEAVEMHMADAGSPALIREEGRAEDFAIVVPMRIAVN